MEEDDDDFQPMCNTIDICGGAFTAELVKGKDGKSRWTYTPNLKKMAPKKPAPLKGTLKEKPQFKIIEEYEAEAVGNYNSLLKDTTLEITKYLVSLAK